ncbi:nuclear transport factor 2 family protein [Streptomyces luteocolor]|uniref:nuclear transport factor 2 family protein n=1 Tax=Streptomyces luteocolor TaxID=285500 RepID=UPI00099F3EF0|nr:nuclear transport factor 2 family protein [Streptomyces luteocolor]
MLDQRLDEPDAVAEAAEERALADPRGRRDVVHGHAVGVAPPGAPRRLDGRSAVRAYMTAYPDHIDLAAIPHVEIHRTTDPEVVIVEMRSEGRSVSTGRDFEMEYVAVVTVKDGLITHYRDYWNPLTALEIAGGTDAPFAGGAR